MYFYNYPSFISSGLKTIDSYLLDFARQYRNHEVSAQWIQGFTAFLKRKQTEYIKLHPRVKPVEIRCVFDKNCISGNGAHIQCGGFYVHLDPVEAVHETFEEPLL